VPIRSRRDPLAPLLLLWLACVSASPAEAEPVRVAVASNFVGIAERLASDFSASSAHEVELVSGSTGRLYAQIVRGAPFDVFLAADEARPRRLEESGHAVAGSRQTYALGRLVLWGGGHARFPSLGPEILSGEAYRHLAIPNPDLAPYGAASIEVLRSLGLERSVEPRLVYGENVAQAFALVASGNAELGLVALAQLVARGDEAGPAWIVPASHHAPIRQQLVLLSRAAGAEGARDFAAWMVGPVARDRIRAAGFEVGE